MIEHADEPVPGLPGRLPPGERLLWQGKPDWRVLARTAFHTRLVAAYFVLLAGWGLASGGVTASGLAGAATTLAVGAVAVALLHLLAFAAARSTIYTLTDHRVVLRVGVAVPKCVNLPLVAIESADVAVRGDGTGEIRLRLSGTPKLGYLALWPHARPWRIVAPQPMLRAVPEAASVAALLARNCLAANPDGRITPVEQPRAPVPALTEPSLTEPPLTEPVPA